MVATIRDVADRAGVSAKTVSRVINHYPHIRPEVVSRVTAAISALGWVPNSQARTLRTGRTGALAIAVPHLVQPELGMLVETIVAEASRQGFRSTVELTGGRIDDLRRFIELRGRSVDAVVVAGPHDGPVPHDDTPTRTPVIVLDGARSAGPAVSIGADLIEAIDLVVRHLVILGRRAPALVGWSETAADDVLGLVRTALADHGLGDREIPRGPRRPAGRWGRQAGADAAVELCARHEIDALICDTDEVALGALRGLADLGIDVPAEVAVVGYGNLDESRFAVPSLTSVDPGRAHVARATIDQVIALSSGAAPAGRAIVVPVELVRRESTLGDGAM